MEDDLFEGGADLTSSFFLLPLLQIYTSCEHRSDSICPSSS